MMRRLLIILFMAGGLVAYAEHSAGTSLQLVFADKHAARALLASNDAYLQNLSRFDLESRLQRLENISIEAYVQQAQAGVQEWKAGERKRLRHLLANIQQRLVPYELPWPEQVMLIKVSGQLEAHAAYTRHNAIILPQSMLARYGDQQLEFILAHELFHILSRQNPGLRQAGYAIIGFHPCNVVKFPARLAARRISNPDAPQNDAYIHVKVKGREVDVVPVIYASQEHFDTGSKGSFFSYLTLAFMEIAQNNGHYSPVLDEGDARLYPVGEVDNLYDLIGENTRYIIHPEEILADNFAILLTPGARINTPAIQTQLDMLLRSWREGIKQ